MTPEITAGIILVVVAFFLVLCDRVLRINEGFANWDTSIPEGMCGVGLAPCPFGTACINGYCKTTQPPTLPYFSDLPVKPYGYSK
jgi:hypothetical protein